MALCEKMDSLHSPPGPPRTCPECQRPVAASSVACPRCGAVYHEECGPASGCVVPGCQELENRPRAVLPPSVPWRCAQFLLAACGICLVAMYLRSLTQPWGRLSSESVPGIGALVFLVLSLIAVVIASLDDFRTGAAAEHPAGTGGLMLLGGVPFAAAAAAVLDGTENTVCNVLLVGHVLALCAGLVGLAGDRRKGRGYSAALLGGVLFMLMAVAVPNFRAARHRANTRACYANQKTIVGAMEMYNLDKNTRRVVLDASFFAAFRSGGYLGSIPQDPGFGPGTSSHYHESSSGNGIRCEKHGSVE